LITWNAADASGERANVGKDRLDETGFGAALRIEIER
jgi:hypothetical protein